MKSKWIRAGAAVLLMAGLLGTGYIGSHKEKALNTIDASVVSTTLSAESEKEEVPAQLLMGSTSTSQIETFHYWLYTPKNPTEHMPLIVYLHGSSGKGDDLNILMEEDGFPQYLKNGQLGVVPAYILIPQLPAEKRGWASVSQSVYQLISETVSTYQIDSDNISLTGHSMGGTGTWNLAVQYPELFARIAPLSGSARGQAAKLEALKDIPVWAFVGSNDTVILPEYSENAVSELNALGGNAQVTIFEGADHFAVPSQTYLDPSIGLVNWLIGSDLPKENHNETVL